MYKNFASLAFTEEVKSLQAKYGSRAGYERMEKNLVVEGLTEDEVHFISERDSFYMASIGTNGFPYIQHRGGPAGFLKVIDAATLGFIDFSGNKQYITTGNLATHDKVALFMMDYRAKARLKIFARAEIVALNQRRDLFDRLDLVDYKFKPERMMLLHVEAFDWNCPQHITERFTVKEVEEALAPQRAYIKQLEMQLAELRSKQ